MVFRQRRLLLVMAAFFFSMMHLCQYVFVISGPQLVTWGEQRDEQQRNADHGSLNQVFLDDKRRKAVMSLLPLASVNDRIIEQLGLKWSIYIGDKWNTTPDAADVKRKKILVVDGYPRGVYPGDITFKQQKCPVSHCMLTDNSQDAKNVDAVIFQGNIGSDSQRLNKLPHQVWIFYQLESPVHTDVLNPRHRGYINWTATYRADSTIVTPYAKFVPYNLQRDVVESLKRDFTKGKTKLIAWFVSNCDTTNERMQYVNRLKRHIPVDVYGDCGSLKCSRKDTAKCFLMLRQQYKFYLAFENSSCKDYITEKLFVNSLQNNIVPVVLGAPSDDYRRVAPPGSYIHVDEFKSPQHLAEYLYRVDNNSSLYNQFFLWKDHGRFIKTKFWCRLCAMLYHLEGHVSWYNDIDAWWRQSNICVRQGNK